MGRSVSLIVIVLCLLSLSACKVDKENENGTKLNELSQSLDVEAFTIMGKVVCAKCKGDDLMDISAWEENGSSPVSINSANGGNLVQRFYENGEFKFEDVELLPGSKIRIMVLTQDLYKAEEEVDVPDDGHTIKVTITLP